MYAVLNQDMCLVQFFLKTFWSPYIIDPLWGRAATNFACLSPTASMFVARGLCESFVVPNKAEMESAIHSAEEDNLFGQFLKKLKTKNRFILVRT